MAKQPASSMQRQRSDEGKQAQANRHRVKLEQEGSVPSRAYIFHMRRRCYTATEQKQARCVKAIASRAVPIKEAEQ